MKLRLTPYDPDQDLRDRHARALDALAYTMHFEPAPSVPETEDRSAINASNWRKSAAGRLHNRKRMAARREARRLERLKEAAP